jgi:polysaccharide deacetylase family protein (PEP-CTERM system associated)
LSNSVKSILLTFDVEDWFQVENFKAVISKANWDSLEYRVTYGTLKILDLLDEYSTSTTKLRATFFVLGWTAQRYPNLVREIDNRGHEISSHGYSHTLTPHLSDRKLIEDLTESKKILENLTGKAVKGYRAPSFSITPKLIEYLQEAGYQYDSSYNSFDRHGRYGSISLKSTEQSGTAYRFPNGLMELPISNLELKKNILPWGGGGYFRLIPVSLYIKGVKAVLRRQNIFVFYAHPWEFDPEQPRIRNGLPLSFRFRHYVNLKRTEIKLKRLMRALKHCNFMTCQEYLSHQWAGND